VPAPAGTSFLRPAWVVVLLLAVLGAAAGCGRGADRTEVAATTEATPTIQPDDLVDLTVYFREGSGAGAYLVPVTREVRVTDDLPRTAVELLLAGPQEGDGANLSAPLPPCQVRDLAVDGGTATVDLSAEVIDEAGSVGSSPENEVLGLASLAATLTEFPGIERVRLLVEGQDQGSRSGLDVDAFWGGWGLPPLLVRDDSVIGPPRDGDGVPDLAQFTAETQESGSDGAAPVQVVSVRTRDRTTFVRVVIELADGADPDAAATVPPTRARPAGDGDVLVDISHVVGVDADALPSGDNLDQATYGISDILVDHSRLPGRVTVEVAVDGERPFRLHTLTSPTRVVLDVKK
jgi:hypothetical protein